MKWPGPYEGGVTQSLISKFKECPLRFYLWAALGLEEAGEPEPNLIWGCICHVGLEHLIAKPYQRIEFTPEDWREIHEGIDEYITSDWPMTPITFAPSVKNMLTLYDDSYKAEHGKFETEKKFKVPHTTTSGNVVTLKGKADGIQVEHGNILVEHKCKGKININQTYLESPLDLQVTVYCHVLGPRTVIYDLIRIPDTQWSLPPQRQMQRPKNYINSLYEDKQWGDFPIFQKKHLWVQQTTINLTDEIIERNMAETVDPIIDQLCEYWEYVSDSNFDWQNPKHYNKIFYKSPIRHFDAARTQSYKCSYWNYLVGQTDLEDLQPVKSFTPELD